MEELNNGILSTPVDFSPLKNGIHISPGQGRLKWRRPLKWRRLKWRRLSNGGYLIKTVSSVLHNLAHKEIFSFSNKCWTPTSWSTNKRDRTQILPSKSSQSGTGSFTWTEIWAKPWMGGRQKKRQNWSSGKSTALRSGGRFCKSRAIGEWRVVGN